MDVNETMARIESQLEQIERDERANQQEQKQLTEQILRLETELKQCQKRRDELDEGALKLHARSEELRPKLDKLERIANLSKEFLELHNECQDNQDLLTTLYSSVSTELIENSDRVLLNSPLFKQQPDKPALSNPPNYSQYSISIEEIKDALPNAERVYQKLVANYLEEYKTYQNYIVDGLDVIWYAVAFIAFGRSSYRQMGFKYHPDLDGSQRAMQLINTAWSISQSYLANPANNSSTINTL